jgi:hypothetical protein
MENFHFVVSFQYRTNKKKNDPPGRERNSMLVELGYKIARSVQSQSFPRLHLQPFCSLINFQVRRHDICFQWSPIDGAEKPVLCRRWEVNTRSGCWRCCKGNWSFFYTRFPVEFPWCGYWGTAIILHIEITYTIFLSQGFQFKGYNYFVHLPLLVLCILLTITQD